MTTLRSELVPIIKEELSQSEELMRTIPFRADQRLSDDERRLLWNAVQHGQVLLNLLVPMQADVLKALEYLDAAGIWTGADELVHDRVKAVLDGYCKQFKADDSEAQS